MTERKQMSVSADDVIVVGSGIAGLSCALALAPRPVTVLTKTPRLASGSSLWAKGGIAAAIGPEDKPEYHAADTLSAGAGLSDPEGALRLAEDGVENLQWLVDAGIPFDRSTDGNLALAREAAHRHPRIVHAGGDATGHLMMKSLIERVRNTRSIKVREGTLAHDLTVNDGRVQGLLAYSLSRGWTYHHASHVVLATGGIGMAWWHTTNPREATGDGLAMAARAGASLVDLEFVQFHPTALAVHSHGASLPLLTEALRGAGALLVDESGHRFMRSVHRDAELAPRDVVARAIQSRIASGQRVYLDLRPVLSNGRGELFPQAIDAARNAGLEPTGEPLPVTPAAHYHMGGVQIDHWGRTSVGGLWACGEVATTGIHGANRLASNSLLEALAYGRRVAVGIRDDSGSGNKQPLCAPALPRVPHEHALSKLNNIVDTTRQLMSRCVGVLRSGSTLASASSQLSNLNRQLRALSNRYAPCDAPSPEMLTRWSEARNLVLVARLVTLAALQRKESRGAHYRDDHPTSKPEWQRRQTLTVERLSSQE